MKENEELYARIEELEKELAEERIRRKITEDNSDCALWEDVYKRQNLICAGVLMSLLPALIVFLLCQKQIYSGITSGAVKG